MPSSCSPNAAHLLRKIEWRLTVLPTEAPVNRYLRYLDTGHLSASGVGQSVVGQMHECDK